jgi:hypothetical protein
MNQFKRIVLAVALLAVAGAAAASSVNVVVDAAANSLGGGTALDSGIFLGAGQSFSISANPADLWNNSGFDPVYVSNADGHAFQSGTLGGLYDAIGSLVGEIGDGPLFHVGTSLEATAATAGELKFFYFDSDAWNNTGAVHVEVTAVPEPGNLALMGLAMGAFALMRRRKA